MHTSTMTVGAFRAVIKDLPDDAPIAVAWDPAFSPGDSDPTVTVTRFSAGTDGACIRVRLDPLESDDDAGGACDRCGKHVENGEGRYPEGTDDRICAECAREEA